MTIKKKNIVLILGGRGFIGGHLTAALLERGTRVITMDSGLFAPSLPFLKYKSHPLLLDLAADVSKVDEFQNISRKIPPLNVIVNCTGPARPSYYLHQPLETMETLYGGTRNALNLAAHHGALYVHASSSEIYGGEIETPLSEETGGFVNPLSTRAPYAEAKRASETLIKAFSDRLGVRALILRLFNVYGPGYGDDDDRVIPALVTALNNTKAFIMYGSGKQTRCFSYIDDVVRAFELSIMAKPDKLICMNIGDYEPISIADLVGIFQDLIGYTLHIKKHAPRPDEVMWRIPDISRAKHYLGWSPTVTLLDGLKRTLSSMIQAVELRGRTQSWGYTKPTESDEDRHGH